MLEYQILYNLFVTEYQKTYFTQIRSNNERKTKKQGLEKGKDDGWKEEDERNNFFSVINKRNFPRRR